MESAFCSKLYGTSRAESPVRQPRHGDGGERALGISRSLYLCAVVVVASDLCGGDDLLQGNGYNSWKEKVVTGMKSAPLSLAPVLCLARLATYPTDDHRHGLF